MFYLTMHSTYFIYGYMASDIWLRTILIVRKETRCRHIDYSFRLTARVLLYAPSHRQDSTYHSLCYTSRGPPGGGDVAQSIARPPLKRSVVGSILLSGPSCSLGYFPFQPVVQNWFIKGRGMYCSVYGKVHIKDPLLLIEKSSLCGGSGFPSKKCVNVTI